MSSEGVGKTNYNLFNKLLTCVEMEYFLQCALLTIVLAANVPMH